MHINFDSIFISNFDFSIGHVQVLFFFFKFWNNSNWVHFFFYKCLMRVWILSIDSRDINKHRFSIFFLFNHKIKFSRFSQLLIINWKTWKGNWTVEDMPFRHYFVTCTFYSQRAFLTCYEIIIIHMHKLRHNFKI